MVNLVDIHLWIYKTNEMLPACNAQKLKYAYYIKLKTSQDRKSK